MLSTLKGYLVGAVFTKKSNKKFTTLALTDFKVIVNAFKDNEPGIDFNLFVMNPTKYGDQLHGVYMYYHQTMKTRAFNQFMRIRFAEIQGPKREKAIKAAGNDGRKIKQAKAENPINMIAAVKIQAGDIPAWIANLSRISSLSYEISSTMPGGGVFNDIGDAVAHRRMRVSFWAKASYESVSKNVLAFLQRFSLRRGRIEGEDKKRRKVSAPLKNPPGIFQMFEYDDVVKQDFIDTKSIAKSALIEDMVELAIGNQAEFGPKPLADKS